MCVMWEKKKKEDTLKKLKHKIPIKVPNTYGGMKSLPV